MEILVDCPGCGTQLTAPPELAGRKAKCWKCGLVMVVPDRPPARVSRRRDEEEDQPVRRRRSSSGPVLLVAGLVGLVLLVGGVGALWFYFREGRPRVATEVEPLQVPTADPDGGPKAAVPAGWKRFSPARGGFRVYAPGDPSEAREVRGNLAAQGLDGAMYQSTGEGGGPLCVIGFVEFPGTLPRDKRDEVVDEMINGGKTGGNAREVSRRAVTLAGRPATEVVLELRQPAKPQMVARFLVTGTHAYFLIIGTETGRPSAAHQKAFFDSFELTSGGAK